MRKNCSEIQKFETPEVAQKLPCTARTGLLTVSTISPCNADFLRIWSKTLLHPPVWHNISTAWIERHVQYFFKSKETRPSGHQKEKEKETGNGQNFWIASLNANLLHQSKNNKDILSFCWRCQVFWKKKKKRFPCLFQKRCWYQKNVEEGLGIG